MEFLTDPWSWWIDPFTSDPVMQRALVAGLLTVLATSIIGTWVVIRGMSFLGDALAHGVLPGIAVAVIIGGNTTVGAMVAALAMVGGISLVRAHSPLPEDTSIGILFVGFLALGVVIASTDAAGGYGDLDHILFGSVEGIDDDDLVRQAMAAVVVLSGVVVFYRALLVATFNEVQARLLGLRPRLAHVLLLLLLAISIITSFEAVGNLLVFAFLIAPPATATLLVRRIPAVMTAAVGIGAIAVLGGLLLSYHHETAPSATTALFAVGLFLFTLVTVSMRAAIRDAGRRSLRRGRSDPALPEPSATR